MLPPRICADRHPTLVPDECSHCRQHTPNAGRRAARVALPTVGPCDHEGPVLEWCTGCSGEARHVRDCDLHERCTRGVVSARVRSCSTCGDFTADVARPADPRVGIVIGHYGWPSLVEMQIRLARRTCGAVPILVSSDDPPADAALSAICNAHDDAVLSISPERIGHTGGDLAALWRGVQWAKARGLTHLVKVSQRFLVARPRWLQEAAVELAASGLPLAARRCRGRETFPLRTEALVMDVAAWSRPEVLDSIKPRRYWHDLPGGRNAEMVVHEVLGRHLGGVYWPWSLVGEDRYLPSPGVVWHCSHGRRDYEALAKGLGVELDAGFHVSGWQGERAKGEYMYG